MASDSDSSLEALVMSRLHKPTPAPVRESPETPIPRSLKRRKKRSRRRVPPPISPSAPSIPPTSSTQAEILSKTLVKTPKVVQRESQSSRRWSLPTTRNSSEDQIRGVSTGRIRKSDNNNKSTMERVDAVRFVEQHRREVNWYGSKGLTKKDRKKFEMEERIKLGCRRPKNEKVPIGILQGMRKKEKERAKKQKELDLASGMLIRSKRRT